MLKKLTPPREYAAPSVDVLEIVSEQEMFTGSLNWDESIDHELDWGNNNQYE